MNQFKDISLLCSDLETIYNEISDCVAGAPDEIVPLLKVAARKIDSAMIEIDEATVLFTGHKGDRNG